MIPVYLPELDPANQMHVFRLTDCEWWMARTLDEAKTDYTQVTGEQADDDARQLSEEDLDRLWYVDTNEDETPNATMRCSFRQELANRIATGISKPEVFACTDY